MNDGSVKIDITADDSDIKKKIDGVDDLAEDAADGLDKLGDSAKDAGKEFGAADVAIGTFVGDALTSLKDNIIETIGNIAALADETREYREDMAKLDTAFTDAGHSTETAQKAYDGFYRILGESDRSVEAVNHLAELTKNEEEVAKWSTIAAGVTAKFGDSLPIEGLTEAANETAKVGAVTGPLADALNWAGISEDEFNKKLEACNSEQERATLITETLNNEYAAAAEEYNELTAGAQAARDATNNMEQAQARLGETIEPLTTAWTNFRAGALQWMIDNWNVVVTALAGITTALVLLNAATIKQTIATWASNAAWLASPITWVVLGITALVAGFMLLWNNCEGFRNFWIGLWEKVKQVLAPVIEWLKQAFAQAWEAIKKVWDFVKPYFTMVWENIKVIFSVVKAYLYGYFNTAWEAIKAVWNTVKAYFTAVWETIKGIFAVVKAVLSGNWKEAWEAIKKIVSAWGDYFKTIWDGIKNVFGAVKEWFGGTFKAAWDGIKAIWGNVKQFFSDTWTKIKDAFNLGDMLKIGKDLLTGLWNGINDKIAWLKGKVKGVVDTIKGWFTGKDGFDEHSPSKWAEQVAVYINEGLAIGLEKSLNKPVEASEKVFEAMRKKTEEGQESIIDTVKGYNAELVELGKKLIEDKKKENADLEALDKKHAEETAKIQDSIKKTIDDRMKEIVSLGDAYKENVKKIWDDLDKSITDLQANYDNQLASRTASIANSLNLWGEASKNITTGATLKKNLQSQVDVLEDYNKAIATLEERNISTAFINSLKEMGVGATGEIEALARMTDEKLSAYVELWEKKNDLARTAAVEELEPLKAETEAKIAELSDAALDKYAELRAKYKEQGALLMAELKQAMIEAGGGGYEEIIGQIDEYTEAGSDLMGGVIAGIIDRSPDVVQAVTSAVNRSIAAAKQAAGIASPSKVMKKEVGANLAEGVKVGWADKIADIKDKMALDMQGITARVQAVVSAENARMAQGVGVRDMGFTEVAQAVGMQTAGINSLASEYRRGSSASVTIPLVLDGRELGRAIVDLGNEEKARIGANLVLA